MLNENYRHEISWLFDQYANKKLDYCILRGYDNLPAISGHDVDIIIRKKDWDKHTALLRIMTHMYGLKIKKTILMPYAKRFYFYKGDDSKVGERQLILDYHFDEQWMGASFLEFDEIPKSLFKTFVVATDCIAPLLPFITFLLSTNGVLQKYVVNLSRMAIEKEDEFKEIVTTIMGYELGEKFIESIRVLDKPGIARISTPLKKYIWCRAFRRHPLTTPVMALETLIKLVWHKRILKNYPP